MEVIDDKDNEDIACEREPSIDEYKEEREESSEDLGLVDDFKLEELDDVSEELSVSGDDRSKAALIGSSYFSVDSRNSVIYKSKQEKRQE